LIVFITSLVASLFSPQSSVSAESYTVQYHLLLEVEDQPSTTIEVQGFPETTATLAFSGEDLGNFNSLQTVFTDIQVTDTQGNMLPWNWAGKKIVVNNGSSRDFTVKYTIYALNYSEKQSTNPGAKKIAVFRASRIFFIAGEVFPTPEMEPEKITVDYSLPEGTSLYSSMYSEDGKFVATKDLWGSYQYDFPKAYFAGGRAMFSLTHTTEWGDEYEYIWFDRDLSSEAWTPSYGNTPWEQAELYMQTAEGCAKYYREAIGSLPTHRVLFTNGIVQYDGAVSGTTNQDWFHYLQIWPQNSEPEVCHHMFHQYSFFTRQSKMPFTQGDAISNMLTEGLSTYYEQTVPTLLSGDPRFEGKFFEFYTLDERGARYGIRSNTANHVRYNRSAVKVYLLDDYIRSVTNDEKSLDDFVAAIWERVKDRSEPQAVNQSVIIEAFSSVVGSENAGYLSSLANLTTFDVTDFENNRTSFDAYSDWMSQTYFWGKNILYYIYLDIAAAKGEIWPHFATYPHNLPRMRQEALQPFWDYLSQNADTELSEQDILDAMKAATGRDHSGFFEFWESQGIVLDPQELVDLSSWNPNSRSLEDALPQVFNCIGTLETTHLLRGIPQNATFVLDDPVESNEIYIQYQLFSQTGFITDQQIANVIQGENVTPMGYFTYMYENIYISGLTIKITTDDPEGKSFPVTLTYPSGEEFSRFAVSPSIENGEPIGEIYYLGYLDPIEFPMANNANTVQLPDTPLDGESYLVTNNGNETPMMPGETFTMVESQDAVKVVLLDQYGFERGEESVQPISNLLPENTSETGSLFEQNRLLFIIGGGVVFLLLSILIWSISHRKKEI